MEAAVNRGEVLEALQKRGLTLKKWCEIEGYGYQTASLVIRGLSRAYYGKGKEIAEKLNALVRGEA